ncbi:MAG: hypothetical protein ACQEQS_01940 [Thermodesulfobacteriota bacterium]
MKKKYIIIIIVLIVFNFVSFYSGYFFCLLGNSSSSENKTKDYQALVKYSESFTPECDDLKTEGLRIAENNSGSYLLTKTMDNYFYVIGLKFDEKKQPLFYYWGGDKEFEIKERCKDNN